MRSLLALVICFAALPAFAEEKPLRVVTLGSAVTETAWALGLGDAVVGVDQSSQYPAAAREKPHVGYYRSVAAEGILCLLYTSPSPRD